MLAITRCVAAHSQPDNAALSIVAGLQGDNITRRYTSLNSKEARKLQTTPIQPKRSSWASTSTAPFPTSALRYSTYEGGAPTRYKRLTPRLNSDELIRRSYRSSGTFGSIPWRRAARHEEGETLGRDKSSNLATEREGLKLTHTKTDAETEIEELTRAQQTLAGLMSRNAAGGNLMDRKEPSKSLDATGYEESGLVKHYSIGTTGESEILEGKSKLYDAIEESVKLLEDFDDHMTLARMPVTGRHNQEKVREQDIRGIALKSEEEARETTSPEDFAEVVFPMAQREINDISLSAENSSKWSKGTSFANLRVEAEEAEMLLKKEGKWKQVETKQSDTGLNRYAALHDGPTSITSLEHDNEIPMRSDDQYFRPQSVNWYVAIVIDTDQLLYLPNIVRQEEDGAEYIFKIIQRNVSRDLGLQGLIPMERIRFTSFCNMSGMVPMYCVVTNMTSMKQFRSFIDSLTNSYPFFNHIDAGKGKGAADKKVTAHFLDHHQDSNCAKVYLGGLRDAGYRETLKDLRTLGQLNKVKILCNPQYQHYYDNEERFQDLEVDWGNQLFATTNALLHQGKIVKITEEERRHSMTSMNPIPEGRTYRYEEDGKPSISKEWQNIHEDGHSNKPKRGEVHGEIWGVRLLTSRSIREEKDRIPST